MIKDLLLPVSDRGVSIQLAVSAVVGPVTVAMLIRSGQRDVAWFAGGLLVLWLAFAGFRSLH